MSKVYYGFKITGFHNCEFLSQFHNFYYVPNVQGTGFIGVEINSNDNEHQLKTLRLPAIVNHFDTIIRFSYLKNKQKLLDKISDYAYLEGEPSILIINEYQNKWFKSFSDYEKSIEKIN